MFGIGHAELMVIAVIAFVLFGNRVPQVMRSIGQGINEFRQGVNSPTDEK
jgi:sec-independent protein translocase protein TatA